MLLNFLYDNFSTCINYKSQWYESLDHIHDFSRMISNCETGNIYDFYNMKITDPIVRKNLKFIYNFNGERLGEKIVGQHLFGK